MKNMTNKLEGKDGNIRYSAYVITIPLSLFIRSKCGYDDTFISRLMCLLSHRLLAAKYANGNPY